MNQKRNGPIPVPFWDRVDMTGGPDACWPWKGGHGTGGPGTVTIKRKHLGAPRRAYYLRLRRLPKGLYIHHYCGQRDCCNPSHMYLSPVARLGIPFWDRVDKKTPEECWPWLGGRNSGGYGYLSVRQKPWLAHRYAYFLHFGHLPNGLLVCHHCDM